ncbi:uncharacterized protein [Narcine bancroftii]|uniref:uncharacterized protein n=1 Tax=Narcine bancroftii TaxID=1343680 RepID=UPI0038317F03
MLLTTLRQPRHSMTILVALARTVLAEITIPGTFTNRDIWMINLTFVHYTTIHHLQISLFNVVLVTFATNTMVVWTQSYYGGPLPPNSNTDRHDLDLLQDLLTCWAWTGHLICHVLRCLFQLQEKWKQNTAMKFQQMVGLTRLYGVIGYITDTNTPECSKALQKIMDRDQDVATIENICREHCCEAGPVAAHSVLPQEVPQPLLELRAPELAVVGLRLGPEAVAVEHAGIIEARHHGTDSFGGTPLRAKTARPPHLLGLPLASGSRPADDWSGAAVRQGKAMARRWSGSDVGRSCLADNWSRVGAERMEAEMSSGVWYSCPGKKVLAIHPLIILKTSINSPLFIQHSKKKSPSSANLASRLFSSPGNILCFELRAQSPVMRWWRLASGEPKQTVTLPPLL